MHGMWFCVRSKDAQKQLARTSLTKLFLTVHPYPHRIALSYEMVILHIFMTLLILKRWRCTRLDNILCLLLVLLIPIWILLDWYTIHGKECFQDIRAKLFESRLTLKPLRVLGGNLRVRLATQGKSLRKFNLRALATTCRSVWPGLNSRIKVNRGMIFFMWKCFSRLMFCVAWDM